MIAEEKSRRVLSKSGSRKQRKIEKPMQQVWRKDFTSKEKCPCTGIREKGFKRPVCYSDLKILELYTFFITKSCAFLLRLRATNVNVIA